MYQLTLIVATIMFLAVASLLAYFGGWFSFIFSFLLFGDGSKAYFWLKNKLFIDPYLLVALLFAAAIFAASWIMAYPLLLDWLKRRWD